MYMFNYLKYSDICTLLAPPQYVRTVMEPACTFTYTAAFFTRLLRISHQDLESKCNHLRYNDLRYNHLHLLTDSNRCSHAVTYVLNRPRLSSLLEAVRVLDLQLVLVLGLEHLATVTTRGMCTLHACTCRHCELYEFMHT
jgi:hypothetical protein